MNIMPERPKKIDFKHKKRKLFFALEILAILLCLLFGYLLSFFTISKELSIEIVILITPITIIFMEYLYKKAVC